MNEVKLGTVGPGYWGPNLLRNFAQIGGCRVKTCCDLNEDSLKFAKAQYPDIEITVNYDSLLHDPQIQAIVISAPAKMHYDMAKRAILHGKHVFVEKPLTLDIAHADELVHLVQQNGTRLMVGHLMEYHPAVEKLKAMIQDGEREV